MHDAPELARAREGRATGDRAQRLLRTLVDRRALVLRSGTRVRDLARKLARAWGAADDADDLGGELSAWLAEQEEVEEVCAGDLELGALARGE